MGAAMRSSTKKKPARRRGARGRRIGAESSATRALLLDAAERLVVEDGCSAVSSRRVAAAAGVQPALVHYYFRTMDDLFIAVYRRHAEYHLDRYARILSSDHPLRTLWEINIDAAATAFTMEFVAMANHRKAIRGEIAHYAERFRRMQLEALASALAAAGLPADAFPPPAVLLAMTGLAQVLVLEQSLGVSTGHAEAHAFVERFLRQLDRGHGRRASPARARSSAS
jgi:TetR/AcrR family transcriptional regulator